MLGQSWNGSCQEAAHCWRTGAPGMHATPTATSVEVVEWTLPTCALRSAGSLYRTALRHLAVLSPDACSSWQGCQHLWAPWACGHGLHNSCIPCRAAYPTSSGCAHFGLHAQCTKWYGSTSCCRSSPGCDGLSLASHRQTYRPKVAGHSHRLGITVIQGQHSAGHRPAGSLPQQAERTWKSCLKAVAGSPAHSPWHPNLLGIPSPA